MTHYFKRDYFVHTVIRKQRKKSPFPENATNKSAG